MKKTLLGIIALIIVSSLPAQTVNGKLTVWSFTDEVASLVNEYYNPSHPNVKVTYSGISYDQFLNRLDPVLASGRGTPDIITLEAAFVRKYVESGQLLDLTDIYEKNKAKLLAYPVEIGTYNGKVYALSWQACPGAMFYRRSLARRYLGTDDPKVVQTYFANFNKFLETAQLLKTRADGSCVVVSSLKELFNSFIYARKDPWLVNGRLVIDPVMEQYMDICKTLYDNRWEGRVGQWSEGWFAGMRGELKDESRRSVEVFSYFLPTWGLHYVLKTNAPNTSGDWAMIPGPSSYYWGGTWLCAYKGTKNPRAALDMIEYLTTNDAFFEQYAINTGDMITNTRVIDKIKGNYSESFIGGQNHYAEFAEIAKTVNGRLLQKTDEIIGELFQETVAAFVNGEKSKAQALADFRTQVQRQLGL
jgi:ABC-type glycerol-3-phosphate transport system substrate-binding protein